MSKNILIDTTNNNETRIAVTEDGKLDDFEIETNKKNAVKGDVYLAKITRIEPSLQAAFVDFGTNRNGFLPLTEIHPDYFKIPAADEEKIKELNDKINNEIEEDDLQNSENVNELNQTENEDIESKSEEEQKNAELKEKRRRERALKLIKEEEEKQKQLEYIKIKEWEEKFDRDQKEREHKENLREQKLRQKELEKLRAFEEKEDLVDNNFSKSLEEFDVDKTKEN